MRQPLALRNRIPEQSARIWQGMTIEEVSERTTRLVLRIEVALPELPMNARRRRCLASTQKAHDNHAKNDSVHLIERLNVRLNNSSRGLGAG